MSEGHPPIIAIIKIITQNVNKTDNDQEGKKRENPLESKRNGRPFIGIRCPANSSVNKRICQKPNTNDSFTTSTISSLSPLYIGIVHTPLKHSSFYGAGDGRHGETTRQMEKASTGPKEQLLK